MASYRFPILLFQDPSGGQTATLVEDNGDIAAYGSTAAEARQRLRDYLEKTYRQFPWYPAPEFESPELTIQRVEVRAEYSVGDRAHPCGETIAIRVAVVSGRSKSGLLAASLPTLGIRFNYYSADDLIPLVTQYVAGFCRGKTPAEIGRFLLPSGVELDDIVIQAPRERRAREKTAQLDELTAIADPLGAREWRSRYSRAWEREELVNRLISSLRKESSPILLLGDSGTGKTTILADAARRIERGADLPFASENSRAPGDAAASSQKHSHRFWLTSAPRIISGMQYLGMWQERVETIISQTASIGGVLCVENLLDLIRIGGRSSNESIGAFLVPYLQRSEFRLIAEASPAEFDAIRRLLPGLADLFQIIVVPPFSRSQAIDCLSHVAATLRQQNKIDMQRGVVENIYRLFARFMPYQPFPGQATIFVNELFERAQRRHRTSISQSDAIALFIEKTGIPELFLRDEYPLDVQDVIARLHREVIGQERACAAAAGVITTFKAGLNDPARPLGVLLFAGPTGVGKTQLAQSLARFLYGGSASGASALDSARNSRLVRIDMSEYSTPGAAERFLGSADAGPADWIQKIRRQPFTVLLLDEIEKAAPEIFDVLLGVFDEGRLTDPWGRLTHFKSAVIIMTSNLGSLAGTPFGLSKAASLSYESEAVSFFRPEFFNRIDSIVTFDSLSAATVRAIAEKELRDLATREGLSKSRIELSWSPNIIDYLATEGFDPRYGARPLQRAVESLIIAPLARYLVVNPPHAGAHIHLDLDEQQSIQITMV